MTYVARNAKPSNIDIVMRDEVNSIITVCHLFLGSDR